MIPRQFDPFARPPWLCPKQACLHVPHLPYSSPHSRPVANGHNAWFPPATGTLHQPFCLPARRVSPLMAICHPQLQNHFLLGWSARPPPPSLPPTRGISVKGLATARILLAFLPRSPPTDTQPHRGACLLGQGRFPGCADSARAEVLPERVNGVTPGCGGHTLCLRGRGQGEG